MRFRDYLRSRISLLVFFLILLIFLLGMVHLDRANRMLTSNVGYMLAVASLLILGYLLFDYWRLKGYYDKLDALLNEGSGDVVNSLPEPENIEQAWTNQFLTLLYSEMNEKISDLSRAQQENAEFLLAWVHQIKTPIATGKLILENAQAARGVSLGSLQEELEEIEEYVQKVLYYSHLNNFANDYVISRVALESVVKGVVKKHSKSFIYKHLKIVFGEIWYEVETDQKWVAFIIDQIISNAVKYTDNGGTIRVYMEIISGDTKSSEGETEGLAEELLLHIEDTGIGIREEDLSRVFNQSFTGYNGRNTVNSTGLGLYISQKLARKLGHYLTISSIYGQGTRVTVHFPKWTDYFDVT